MRSFHTEADGVDLQVKWGEARSLDSGDGGLAVVDE
jgi:hypothetical protein